jgi:hypothetical protein
MNHLTQKKDALSWVFSQGLVAALDGIFNAITETKVSGQQKGEVT